MIEVSIEMGIDGGNDVSISIGCCYGSLKRSDTKVHFVEKGCGYCLSSQWPLC